MRPAFGTGALVKVEGAWQVHITGWFQQKANLLLGVTQPGQALLGKGTLTNGRLC